MIITRRTSLRKLEPGTELADLLDEQERQAIEQTQNPPLALFNYQANAIHQLFQDGRIDSYKHVKLADAVTRMNEVLSGCERLKKTPFPMQYSWFMTYSLMVFVMLGGKRYTGTNQATRTGVSVLAGRYSRSRQDGASKRCYNQPTAEEIPCPIHLSTSDDFH